MEALVEKQLGHQVDLYQNRPRLSSPNGIGQQEVITWELPQIFTDQSNEKNGPTLLISTPEIIAVRHGGTWEAQPSGDITDQSLTIAHNPDEIEGHRTETEPVQHYILVKGSMGYGVGIDAEQASRAARKGTAVVITADQFKGLSEANVEGVLNDAPGSSYQISKIADLAPILGSIIEEQNSKTFSLDHKPKGVTEIFLDVRKVDYNASSVLAKMAEIFVDKPTLLLEQSSSIYPLFTAYRLQPGDGLIVNPTTNRVVEVKRPNAS